MPKNPITVSLPQDLPENWVYGQTIAPKGEDVGLAQQYGYNYLMQQVNAAQQAAEELGEAFARLTAADVGAAPGGFGLGESSAKPIEDFNTAWRSGWYYTTSSDIGIAHWPDGMSQYCLVCTDCRGSSAYQTAYDYGKMAVRFTQQTSDPEAWQPWEWVNPPMLLGVEYQTTERYNGKPVYAKLVNFGALPNATYKYVVVDNAAQVIRVSGLTSDGRTLPGTNGVAQTGIITCAGVGTQVQIVTYEDQSSLTATVCAWYTKTTD